MDERFIVIKRPEPCMCGMPVYDVTDTTDGYVTVAHIGTLNPYDKAHTAAANVWRAELGLPPHNKNRETS